MPRRLFAPFAFGLLLVACEVCRAAGEDDTPTPGKSKIIPAASLKEVETFRRKVVFFAKDVDLPCLRLPAPGERTPGFIFTTGAIRLIASQPCSEHMEMTNDSELVFVVHKMAIRINQGGKAEKLFALSELTLTGAQPPSKGLHFENLLGASPAASVVYVGLSNAPMESGQSVSPKVYSYFLGRLDIPARRLALVPYDDYPYDVVLDAEEEKFYQVRSATAEARTVNGETVYDGHEGFIKCRDFAGKTLKQWPLPGNIASAALSPDRRSLLLIPATGLMERSDAKIHFELLDVKTGDCADLPITGCGAAAWGTDQTIYYLRETSNDGVLETKLFRRRLGEKKSTRLFRVLCKTKETNMYLARAPRLSADRSWLTWQLPVEDYRESGTILLDVTSGEYRIMRGHWEGVQWTPTTIFVGR